jgi:hypothetical protein
MSDASMETDPENEHSLPRLVRRWDECGVDIAASQLERETALLIEWNQCLLENAELKQAGYTLAMKVLQSELQTDDEQRSAIERFIPPNG